MAKVIEFNITDGGEVNIEMEGYTGKECDAAMKKVVHPDFLKGAQIENTADYHKTSNKKTETA